MEDPLRGRILAAVRELRLRELRLVGGNEPPSPSVPYVPTPPLPDEPNMPEPQPSPDPNIYPIHPNIPEQPIHAPEPKEAPPLVR